MAAPKPKQVCNGDCFHCPYPDCILDDNADHEFDALISADVDRAVKDRPPRTARRPKKVVSEEVMQRRREYSRMRYAAHRDERRAYKRYWYQQNKQQVRERRERRAAENNYIPIGLEIRRLRKEARLTQPALGKLVGVAGCTIFKWEHAESPPQLDRVIEAIRKYKETQDV